MIPEPLFIQDAQRTLQEVLEHLRLCHACGRGGDEREMEQMYAPTYLKSNEHEWVCQECCSSIFSEIEADRVSESNAERRNEEILYGYELPADW